jgi:cytochrome P450
MTPEQIADATTAITELQTYVDELTTRRKDPGRDLITALLEAEADGERLTRRNRRYDRQSACGRT